jgi:hypothetical protein
MYTHDTLYYATSYKTRFKYLIFFDIMLWLNINIQECKLLVRMISFLGWYFNNICYVERTMFKKNYNHFITNCAHIYDYLFYFINLNVFLMCVEMF